MIRDEVGILLVEDDPLDAELAIRALRANNIVNQIHTVRSGQDALDLLLSPRRRGGPGRPSFPGMILLDLKLPDFDGIEVLRRLRKDPSTGSLAVVVLTCSKAQQDIIQSSRLGINGYILKPVNAEQFWETVRRFPMSWLLVDAQAKRAAKEEEARP